MYLHTYHVKQNSEEYILIVFINFFWNMSLEIHEDKSSQFCILYTFLWILMLKDLVNFLTIPLQKKKSC